MSAQDCPKHEFELQQPADPALAAVLNRCALVLGRSPTDPLVGMVIGRVAPEIGRALACDKAIPAEDLRAAFGRLAAAIHLREYAPPTTVSSDLLGWIAPLHTAIRGAARTRVEDLRAYALVQAAALGTRVNGALANGLRQSVVGRQSWKRIYGQLDPAALQVLMEQPGQRTAQRAFLCQAALLSEWAETQRAAGWPALRALVPSSTAVPASVPAACVQTVASTPVDAETPPAREMVERVLMHKLVRRSFASDTHTAGICPSIDAHGIRELRRVFGGNGEMTAEVALAQLVLLTSSTLHVLQSIRLSADKDDLWIDLDGGCLTWDWAAVTNLQPSYWTPHPGRQHTARWLRIPLPRSLNTFLSARLSTQPGAQRVGDLFDAGEIQEERLNRTLARRLGSKQRGLQSILAQSYGRVLISRGVDELQAAAQSADFSITPQAAFHYAVIDPRDIQAVSERTYIALGLDPPVALGHGELVGTPFCAKEERVAQSVKHLLTKASQALCRLRHRAPVTRMRRIHNVLAQVLSIVVGLFSGHRTPTSMQLSATDYCSEILAVCIIDKNQNDFHQHRIVPLPTIVAAWLDTYWDLRRRMWERLVRRGDADDHEDRGAVPLFPSGIVGPPSTWLFSTITRAGRHEPCAPRQLVKLAQQLGVNVNFSRHLFDRLLRSRGITSSEIHAVMGRGEANQLLHGTASLVPIGTTLERVRKALDAALVGWNLPAPPSAAKRAVLDRSLSRPQEA